MTNLDQLIHLIALRRTLCEQKADESRAQAKYDSSLLEVLYRIVPATAQTDLPVLRVLNSNGVDEIAEHDRLLTERQAPISEEITRIIDSLTIENIFDGLEGGGENA